LHWRKQLAHSSLRHWKSDMNELQSIGQVSGSLARSCLKDAYLNMMPRSAMGCMHSVKQVLEDFMREMQLYESGAAESTVDTAYLSSIFTTFEQDVRRRMQIAKQLPTRNEAVTFAQSKQTDEMRLEDVGGSPDRVEEYFSRIASEMVAGWEASYVKAMEFAYDEVSKAETKWQRTVDHYLRKQNVDVVLRRKVLNEAVEVNLIKSKSCQIPQTRAKDLTFQHAAQVPYTKTKRFLQPTKKEYTLLPEQLERFCAEYWRLWVETAEANAEENLVAPIRDNFQSMCSTIDETKRRRERGALMQEEKFDFTFAHILAEVLPLVADFDISDPNHVDDEEVKLLEAVCTRVNDAAQRIMTTDGYQVGRELQQQQQVGRELDPIRKFR